MIGVSLRWLLERQGVDPDQLYVHLFASDQAPIVPERERQKDSILLARVIEGHLMHQGLSYRSDGETRRLRLAGRQVHVHAIEGNPADYNNMLETFGRELGRLRRYVGEDDRVYLEVTGGTPAMTSMMIVAGVDAFGRRARTLYVERGAEQPYPVGIGRRFFARRARATLREQIRLYAYKAARSTLDRDGDLVDPHADHQALLRALLVYADRRLAFDFERARDALNQARRYATGQQQALIQHRQRELRGQETAALLAELIHSTRIKVELGDYADFTQRLFRFQEGCFRHLAEAMGLQYQGGDERYADMDWVESVPGLTAFLEDYASPVGKAYGRIHLRGRTLNRVSLGAIVDFFVAGGEPWGYLEGAVENLHRLSRVANLRNRGLAGHGFQGIGREDLRAAFGDDPDRIVPLLEAVYAEIFGQDVGESPYEAVNELILGVVEGS
jgi:hypothetical protein